ncbi:MAG: hypothetical protein QF632_00250 [Candidatus Woesearchaeota archaeon]|jgi:hypothetical protein|nr:hypothetical protein [Candidatus Woesearchaeota archaeon]MDP7323171.1 hypothetical protein [Candidatus Woesearchaeota archaeon]MDP7457322.1 hypothetical protein [Candidatus Woesearchaeota archaeon]
MNNQDEVPMDENLPQIPPVTEEILDRLGLHETEDFNFESVSPNRIGNASMATQHYIATQLHIEYPLLGIDHQTVYLTHIPSGVTTNLGYSNKSEHDVGEVILAELRENRGLAEVDIIASNTAGVKKKITFLTSPEELMNNERRLI